MKAEGNWGWCYYKIYYRVGSEEELKKHGLRKPIGVNAALLQTLGKQTNKQTSCQKSKQRKQQLISDFLNSSLVNQMVPPEPPKEDQEVEMI